MSNRVFLNLTNFSKMPKHTQLNKFIDESSKTFEANCSIPIFWLFLFDKNNIKLTQDTYEDQEYIYLISEKDLALKNLEKRSDFISSLLSPSQFNLYEYWLDKIKNSPYYRILIRTEELSWFYENKEFKEELDSAFTQIEESVLHNQDLFKEDFFNLTGLAGIEKWEDCKDESLVGIYINEEGTWPKDIKKYSDESNKTKWWIFWK